MKHFFTSLLACIIFSPVMGQYTFETANEPYTEISNPTYEIPDSSIYFGNVTEKPDMYFESFGEQYDLYDGIYIPVRQGYAYFLNNDYSTTIYAAKGEYAARPGSNQTSVFSFAIEGNAGNRVHVLQWKNMGFEAGDSLDYINFQLRLYEMTGDIEFHYGPSSVGANLYEDGANGPTVGLLEMDETFSTIFNSLWLQGQPSAPAAVSSSTVITLDATPANGTVYRFKPTVVNINQPAWNTEEIKIYPTITDRNNPLKFEAKQGHHTLKIHDLTGREVKTAIELSGNELIDISNLPSGIFTVSVDGSYIAKIVVK